ncbi:MAG: MFS transporter [Candidatus Bathyarchaeia archaeon]
MLSKINIPLRVALANIILIINIIVWYTYASAILEDVVSKASFTRGEKMILDVVLFLSIIASMLTGASLVNKFNSRKRFILAWNLIGIFSSFALLISENATIVNLSCLLILVGLSFGLGLPTCMANFADITTEENRARFGSIVILSMFFGLLAFGFVISANLFLNVLALAVWRLLGLASVILLGNYLENKGQNKSYSIASVFKDRRVLIYLIPWIMFSSINFLSWPICSKIYGEDLFNFSLIINNIIGGVFAFVAGFLADNIGRKRTLVIGFIIFGIGYSALGIYPFNIHAWYFYTVVDGIAWGIIDVIFLFTIWGDLASGKPSEKYYAVGILPYSFSGFLRVTLGQFIVNAVSEYAIFSFAAFFLFLAVVPLMFAPETLPERKIRERELRSYIEKAKRIREKFT